MIDYSSSHSLKLGFTSLGERILHHVQPRPGVAYPSPVIKGRVSLDLLGKLRSNPYAVAENLRLDSLDDVENELRAYQSAGGSVIIESTSCDLHGRKVIRCWTSNPSFLSCLVLSFLFFFFLFFSFLFFRSFFSLTVQMCVCVWTHHQCFR